MTMDACSSAADVWAMRPLAGVTLGPFRLLEQIGRGGMAEVWRAEWTVAPGAVQIVALKRALPHVCARPELAALFVAEKSS